MTSMSSRGQRKGVFNGKVLSHGETVYEVVMDRTMGAELIATYRATYVRAYPSPYVRIVEKRHVRRPRS